MQALSEGHSLLLEHSGLQYGGDPKKLGKHVHDGSSPTSLHIELDPQGDGVQGVTSATGAPRKKIIKIVMKIVFYM